MRKRIDLTGQTFNLLKVLQKDESRQGYYICKCECKTTKSIRGSHLQSGATKSCGCLRTKLSIRSKTSEMIDKTFERLTVRAEHPERSNNGKIQYICDCSCGKTDIIVSGVYLRNGDVRSCGCLKKELDKTMRQNLDRTAIDGTNINILVPNRKTRVDSTTGHIGVHLDKKSGMYRAAIKFKNKLYDLGYHKSLDDAIKARKNAEQITHEAFVEWYNTYKDNLDDAPESPDGSELEKKIKL